MDRRKFLLATSLTAVSLSTFGSIIKKANGTFAGDCDTTNDILGPFYRPNAPQRADLTHESMPGTRLQLKGRVFREDCVTPIKNALVEIWQCSTEGEYDNESEKYTLRSTWLTNAEGEYAFKTILPGKYLNGALYRPAHIHYRVSEKKSKELISQIYFKGDPHIEKDPWASQEKARLRILPLTPEDINGNLVIHFDITLRAK